VGNDRLPIGKTAAGDFFLDELLKIGCRHRFFFIPLPSIPLSLRCASGRRLSNLDLSRLTASRMLPAGQGWTRPC
jgi:hypothetical protein